MSPNFSRALVALALATTATTAQAEMLWGLTFDNRVVSFDSMNPEMIQTSRMVMGLMPGEELIGIDVRPATGDLYTLSTMGNLYRLTISGGNFQAMPTGSLSMPLSGSAFGIDFNPVPDRLRVVSDSGQNLRINVDGGATIADGMVNTDFGPVQLLGAAYTNSRAGATTTTLYAIDAVNDMLLRSTNPNGGTYTNTNAMGAMFQPLGLTFTTMNAVGFDISGRTGKAFANVDSLLWTVDLMTGAAENLGVVGSGPLRSIATMGAVPEPGTWAMLIAGFGMIGAAMRRRRAAPAMTLA